MYGSVVLGIEHHEFEAILEIEREKRGASVDTELDAEGWEAIVGLYKQLVEDTLGQRPSRRLRRSSCGARSARSSARG